MKLEEVKRRATLRALKNHEVNLAEYDAARSALRDHYEEHFGKLLEALREEWQCMACEHSERDYYTCPGHSTGEYPCPGFEPGNKDCATERKLRDIIAEAEEVEGI